MPTTKEQQEALLKALREQKEREAEKTRLLTAKRQSRDIMVHPGTQRAYRWVGNRLVPITPRYIDGLDGYV